MSCKGALSLAVMALVLGTVAWAGEGYQVVNGPKNFYFGHISLTDIRNDGLDPTVQRDGAKAPEPAVLNMPLGPGDVIRTSKERRVEVQFDNATIVRLDFSSELKIETIMAQGLSSASQMSNLVLTKGRLFVMYKQYNSRELFQILTPKAAVKFKHNAVGIVALMPDGATDVQVQYGKAVALYGADLKTPKSFDIAAKERAAFTPDNRFALGEPRPMDDFEIWNKSINDDFETLHEGKTTLPKPVQRLSSAVITWAQRYGSRFGEWLYDDYFGYVWRPNYNDVYPWGSWRPYFAGSWSYYRNAMYWLPSEPWGWIPYHLGVWHWNSKRGWYWIPGSAFAPAWVDWAFFAGNWSWRPWSMWDWGWWSYDSLGWMEWAYGIDGMGYWNWRYPWSMPAQERPFGFRNGEVYVQDIRDKDAFKEVNPQDPKKIKFGRPAAPPFPLPGSYKSGPRVVFGPRPVHQLDGPRRPDGARPSRQSPAFRLVPNRGQDASRRTNLVLLLRSRGRPASSDRCPGRGRIGDRAIPRPAPQSGSGHGFPRGRRVRTPDDRLEPGRALCPEDGRSASVRQRTQRDFVPGAQHDFGQFPV
jgi:hypothetical protein